jgi:hypothetical protein
MQEESNDQELNVEVSQELEISNIRLKRLHQLGNKAREDSERRKNGESDDRQDDEEDESSDSDEGSGGTESEEEEP